MSAAAVAGAQGLATVVVVVALGAAAVALAVSVLQYKDTLHRVQAWHGWEAHTHSADAAERHSKALRVVAAVRGWVTTLLPHAQVTMFGSQALGCADASSDTDIKVVVRNADEVQAVAQGLLAAGFRQAAATKRYLLFRSTMDGMAVDVSVVTTSTPGDSPETLPPALKATKGFLLWYIRTNGGRPPSPGTAAVSVHTYTPKTPR
jgi:GrpB-like predicted nucleotidyltransferase (UPF0157 family)